MSADCVHIACAGKPQCKYGKLTALNQEMGVCEHCGMGCTFVPGSQPLWVRASGRVRDQVTCKMSPTGKHWVNR